MTFIIFTTAEQHVRRFQVLNFNQITHETWTVQIQIHLCFFLSCKANARVKLAKTGHGPHSSTLVVICVVRLLFVLLYVLFVYKCVLPPGDNPIIVNKYINLHPQVEYGSQWVNFRNTHTFLKTHTKFH